MIITLLGIMLWIVGAVTAYPRNKKWRIEEEPIITWTNGDMLQSVFISLMFWWFVWIFIIFVKLDELDWLSKKSRF